LILKSPTGFTITTIPTQTTASTRRAANTEFLVPVPANPWEAFGETGTVVAGEDDVIAYGYNQRDVLRNR
jgi:hypothetical protein